MRKPEVTLQSQRHHFFILKFNVTDPLPLSHFLLIILANPVIHVIDSEGISGLKFFLGEPSSNYPCVGLIHGSISMSPTRNILSSRWNWQNCLWMVYSVPM